MSLTPWRKLLNKAGEKSLLTAMTESPKPTPSSKIAAFDLDDTLISKHGARAGVLMWPSALPDELQRLVADSFTIVILSNQLFKDDRGKQEAEWINKVSKQLPQLKVPFYIYAATKRDYYRKPMPGMIEKHLELYNDGKPLHPDSFFVGDAAGRNRDHNGSSDFSIRCEMVNLKLILHCTTADSDRKMALSVPMTFYTPEEYFLKAKSEKYVLRRLHMNPLKTFELDPFQFKPSEEPEVVLLIGYPGSGKTTFYEQELKTHGYERITSTAQDLNPTKRYVIEKRSLSSSIGRDHALQQARRAHLPVRLLRIDPPGDSPNGAWRQLVWRHHCEKQAQAPPSDAGHAFFNRAARREPLMSARDFAQACKTYSCPHPKSEEAALYQNGVEEVPWSYRGDPEEKERYFRIWAETGEEKNKDLKHLMD